VARTDNLQRRQARVGAVRQARRRRGQGPPHRQVIGIVQPADRTRQRAGTMLDDVVSVRVSVTEGRSAGPLAQSR
jgi:hypothetical protein